MKRLGLIALLVGALAIIVPGFWGRDKADVHIAAASSFAPFLMGLRDDIAQHCQISIEVSAGSSGMLAAQIQNGGPFDIFFSADDIRPQSLIKNGKSKHAQTYAFGRLAYWDTGKGDMDTRPLALADPKLAPYGQASAQSLVHLRQTRNVPTQTVWGRSAAQVFQFVASGAAQAGLVPLSLLRLGVIAEDQYTLVPQDWYSPIRQDVVVLHPSAGADCLMDMVLSPRIQAMMVKAGFGTAL